MFNSRVHINADLKFRKLQIPFSQVSYPSLSADGKWTAFAAADINGKWDVYYMHTGGGEPKRVTYDSSIFVEQSSDISPDGSKIVYNYFNLGKQRFEAIVVSVLGGTGKLVALNSALQRWRPDGTRIGYMQFRNPKNAPYNLWSVNADGSDNKLEFADSLAVGGRFSFCWSPDGSSIAWIRSMKGSYQEVIVKNLVTGKEKQITDEKSNIDDVCWLQNGMILYSSNKNGNSNLWMVPEDGGESQQVTTGTSTDLGISASSDGKTVLYYQQQKTGKIWIGDINSRTSKQITFDDRQIDDVSLQPNGAQVAYIASVSEGDISAGNELFVMDRNGSSRQQLTNGKHTLQRVQWSPGGKYVGYIEHKFNSSPDSSDLIILESSIAASPVHVIHGVLGYLWVNEKLIQVRFPNSVQNCLYNMESKTTSPFYEDSTLAIPVNSSRMILYFERKEGRLGLYIRSSEYKTNPGKFPPKQFIPDQIFKSITRTNIQDQFLYWRDLNNKFFRKNYTTGVIENLTGNYSGFELNSLGNVSPNNKEFAYVAQQANGKFILIENLFK
jgi:TolB protein